MNDYLIGFNFIQICLLFFHSPNKELKYLANPISCDNFVL